MQILDGQSTLHHQGTSHTFYVQMLKCDVLMYCQLSHKREDWKHEIKLRWRLLVLVNRSTFIKDNNFIILQLSLFEILVVTHLYESFSCNILGCNSNALTISFVFSIISLCLLCSVKLFSPLPQVSIKSSRS